MPNIEMETETEQQKENERERRTVHARRVTTAKPQRMQRDLGRGEAAPPTLAELQARQDAMSTTRRRTKPGQDLDESFARDEVNEETLAVPDVESTSSDE